MMINKNKPDNIRPLFSSPVSDFSLPDLVQGKTEDVYDEIELFGFPVTMSWFDMLETSFRGEVSARDMNEIYRQEDQDGRTPGYSKIYQDNKK